MSVAAREEKVTRWRDLAEACTWMAEALDSEDEIMGLLSSRAFIAAASEFDDEFWTILRQEIDDFRRDGP